MTTVDAHTWRPRLQLQVWDSDVVVSATHHPALFGPGGKPLQPPWSHLRPFFFTFPLDSASSASCFKVYEESHPDIKAPFCLPISSAGLCSRLAPDSSFSPSNPALWTVMVPFRSWGLNGSQWERYSERVAQRLEHYMTHLRAIGATGLLLYADHFSSQALSRYPGVQRMLLDGTLMFVEWEFHERLQYNSDQALIYSHALLGLSSCGSNLWLQPVDVDELLYSPDGKPWPEMFDCLTKPYASNPPGVIRLTRINIIASTVGAQNESAIWYSAPDADGRHPLLLYDKVSKLPFAVNIGKYIACPARRIVAVWMHTALPLHGTFREGEHTKSRKHPDRGLALELLLIICPQILICTSALPLWPTLAVLVLAASICYLRDSKHPRHAACQDLPGVDDIAGRRKSFIGIFRGALMAATCLCILAVDFRAFPRRYAKTEVYGTGYMDVGVGGVVLTAGLVSPAGLPADDGGDEAGGRAGKSENGSQPRRRKHQQQPLGRRLLSGLRGAAACWVLGLARLLTTRAVEYQEHVGEYGVHWNFFDTIAVVALLGRAVALPPELLAPAAIVVTAGHQAVLSLGGFGPWVLSAERGTDLLSLNKEGIVSCLGFWALYLWGAALAHAFHVSVQPAIRHLRKRHEESRDEKHGGATAASTLVRWSCNAAYIMWIVAQCLAGMLPLALWQALATAAAASTASSASEDGSCRPGPAPVPCPGDDDGLGSKGGNVERGSGGAGNVAATVPRGTVNCQSAASRAASACQLGARGELGKWGPRVLQAINSNQLAIFLAANLMTGAVNLSCDTLQVGG
ncbi:hypothetical protein VOLCADRAFT_89099 [Volvox carteri f. nagariensis]|uniref:GPI-anchored wall transfer protein 1 n=1 Tax=Volvox carteri f. nagariensis TaxID=3068 RepID=D8TQT0_VOLCA|nr:uncharacterized protein VOLCADRAFT_89099 [Volvox carteri f. nagariensis]EFJ50208.1 hypothetical protein VOLCADRAFT_89099 [Volvox carteri f. nagariensis]|eukprot:XP_002948828.1 hypothetical protein VOLCADRAFT_89099 [Volvox carteri f. nagariensis]